jgi:hypothetical protein
MATFRIWVAMGLPLIASGGRVHFGLFPQRTKKRLDFETDIFAHPSSHQVAPLLFLSSLPLSDQLCC